MGLSLQAQHRDSLWKKRTLSLAAVSAVGIGTHAVLYKTWYSKADKSSFHFYNDNKEWLQIDKIGHAWSTYILSETTHGFFEQNGYREKEAANLSLASALIFQTAIEYFDGRSKKWGASAGDLGANVAGAMWSFGQRKLFGTIKIPLRFSSAPINNLARLRPNVLGSNLPERMLKDYNTQTYWLNFQINKLARPTSKWPRWLGLSVGYGAQGMLGGYRNVFTDQNGLVQDYSYIPRYRQFYLAPNISLSHLRSKHKFINYLYKLTDYIRIPTPSFEMQSAGGVKWNWLHY